MADGPQMTGVPSARASAGGRPNPSASDGNSRGAGPRHQRGPGRVVEVGQFGDTGHARIEAGEERRALPAATAHEEQRWRTGAELFPDVEEKADILARFERADRDGTTAGPRGPPAAGPPVAGPAHRRQGARPRPEDRTGRDGRGLSRQSPWPRSAAGRPVRRARDSGGRGAPPRAARDRDDRAGSCRGRRPRCAPPNHAPPSAPSASGWRSRG